MLKDHFRFYLSDNSRELFFLFPIFRNEIKLEMNRRNLLGDVIAEAWIPSFAMEIRIGLRMFCELWCCEFVFKLFLSFHSTDAADVTLCFHRWCCWSTIKKSTSIGAIRRNISDRVADATEETTVIIPIQRPARATPKARIWSDFCRDKKKLCSCSSDNCEELFLFERIAKDIPIVELVEYF